ncbi:hypothetical protein C8R45DRAFT_964686 [Mycena sanguinolenta]|nr:hypothetical protein C8R45DRAFT_964686 [Mycena sanguinolenta]
MSVQGLRERIAELDTEIGLQRELLKKLERDKILVQRQLNHALDPIARLPLEISSQIFLRCLAPFPTRDAHVPWLLLSICSAWADIALSTPGLWATIHISFPCASSLGKFLPVWLERARYHPLSISLEAEGEIDENVVATIWRHGHQLKHLELCEMREDGVDLLEVATPGPLPSLETLVIRSGSWVFDLHHIIMLLRQTPALVEYVVDTEIWDLLYQGGEKVVLPKLRRLIFGKPGTCPDGGENLLKWLSLSSLEALSIETSGGTLLAFLKQSSPPVLELSVRITGAIDLVALADHVPNVTRFEIWYPEHLVLQNLFAALAESRSPLPHLHTLVVHLRHILEDATPESLWTALARALAARRTHIQVFRLTMGPYRLSAQRLLAPDILATIRTLVMDGMEVYIGTIDGSWNLLD